MLRQLFAYVSVAIGVIFLIVSVLISAAIRLEAKDQGWLELGGAPINWSSLSDLIMYGSVFGCLGALLLFDGLRELQCRANRNALTKSAETDPVVSGLATVPHARPNLSPSATHNPTSGSLDSVTSAAILNPARSLETG